LRIVRNPQLIRNPQSEIRNDAQDLCGVAEVLKYDVGPSCTEVFDGMASRRHRDRSRAGDLGARHVERRIADDHRCSG
jgi:hypothetical protein